MILSRRRSPGLVWRTFFACCFLGLWCTGSEAPAQEAERLRSKVFRVPYGTLDPPQEPKEVDARAYLKKEGFEIPAGGEATYDGKNSSLTVRATQSVIDAIDAWLAKTERSPEMLRVEFTLVEFSVPAGTDWYNLAFEQLRAAAGESWQVLDRATAIA